VAKFRQRFYVTPLVEARGHLRPVVDLYDVAWSWIADLGELRLVQTFAKADVGAKMDRDARMRSVAGDTFGLLQELTHRPGGLEKLREELERTSDLGAAARAACAALSPAE
jgi:hypothetical protein